MRTSMSFIIQGFIALCLFSATTVWAEAKQTETADQLTKLIHEHIKRQNVMFSKGSTVQDVDNLFAMYTPDYIYNHPGQGDIYSRELLYKNSARYAESGGYDGAYLKKVTNIIVGKDAATVEWQWITTGEPDHGKYMTLFEFKDGKISMMREYW